MMKKVLALVMVLSIAGLASAALQIDVVGGQAQVNGQLEGDMYLILSAGDGAVLSNFALGAAAPLASYLEKAGTAADFAAAGAPIPAGFDGEAWYLASFPGEAYKQGTQLMADVAFAKSQDTKTWEEIVTEGCPDGWHKIRTWTEVAEIETGTLSLAFLTTDAEGNVSATDVLGTNVVNNRTVLSSTFVDGECIPEPMTLSLLGLGALVLRRRS